MSTQPPDRATEGAADRDAVSELNAQFYRALRAMFTGDPEPFRAIFSHSDDVIYLPAEGGVIRGYEAAFADWTRQAAASNGGEVEVVGEDIMVHGDMAAVATRTRVILQSPDGPRELTVRESSVCRREEGEWRIAAHHVDALSVWTDVVGDAS